MDNRKLIEKKEWQYYLYELDNCYELLVPIPNPPPGFDVIHTLTAFEEIEFKKSGIVVLKERIKDMKTKSTNYKLNPWR